MCMCVCVRVAWVSERMKPPTPQMLRFWESPSPLLLFSNVTTYKRYVCMCVCAGVGGWCAWHGWAREDEESERERERRSLGPWPPLAYLHTHLVRLSQTTSNVFFVGFVAGNLLMLIPKNKLQQEYAQSTRSPIFRKECVVVFRA
jgi:hypothetical protein